MFNLKYSGRSAAGAAHTGIKDFVLPQSCGVGRTSVPKSMCFTAFFRVLDMFFVSNAKTEQPKQNTDSCSVLYSIISQGCEAKTLASSVFTCIKRSPQLKLTLFTVPPDALLGGFRSHVEQVNNSLIEASLTGNEESLVGACTPKLCSDSLHPTSTGVHCWASNRRI